MIVGFVALSHLNVMMSISIHFPANDISIIVMAE
jgi:hypothetical protein